MLVPYLSGSYRYEALGEAAQVTSTFSGGGSSFQTDGMDTASHVFNFGTGLSFLASDNNEISFGYDYEAKADYSSHTGQLTLSTKF